MQEVRHANKEIRGAEVTLPQVFDPRLESLRGIAALAVAFGHGLSVFRVGSDDYSAHAGITYIINILGQVLRPGPAVILFFVLSGYVLGLSLRNNAEFLPYLIKRLFRIVPLLFLSVTLSFALLICFRAPADATIVTEWYQEISKSRSWLDFIKNLVLLKMTVNGVTWTLNPEMICSLLLCPLAVLHLRVGTSARWGILGILLVIAAFKTEYWLRYFFLFLCRAFSSFRALGFSRKDQAGSVSNGLCWCYLIML